MSDAVSTSVCAEICGSTVIFLCFHKILFLGKGSVSNTSRTACLILPLFKCLIKSYSLMIAPLAKLIILAPLFK